MKIDYVIHAAANTSSESFVDEPVEIIMNAINGTRRILEIAKYNNVKGMVYLSSMEVYGCPKSDLKISEDSESNLNTMSVGFIVCNQIHMKNIDIISWVLLAFSSHGIFGKLDAICLKSF